MDAKEAIKALNTGIAEAKQHYERRKDEDDIIMIELFSVCVEALEKVPVLEAENARLKEKETPVKIRTETEGIYEPYDDVPIGRKVNLYCGKCGKPLNAYHDYCYWCGQAIKIDKE